MPESLPALFATAFFIGLTGALMPGPVFTATISETLRRGFWAGPRIVLGHALLELAVVASVLAGLAGWLQRNGVLGVLGILGGGMLLWLGTSMTRQARAAAEAALAPPSAAGARSAGAWRGPVGAGVVLSLSNPYWLLWWATIGLGLAGQSLRRGVAGLAAFYGGHILSDLAWYSLVAAAVAAGRRILPPALYRRILIACGLGLALLGALFLRDGVRRLARTPAAQTVMTSFSLAASRSSTFLI